MFLSPQQLSQEWRSGRFRPVYYLIGEDGGARAAAIRELKDILKPDPFNLDELSTGSGEEAVAAALTPPAFAERRLVVLKEARLGAEARKALARYLADPLITTTVVLQSDERKPDPRDALAAAAGALGGLAVFKPLSDEAAARRLESEARNAGRALDPEAARWLVEEAGSSWQVLKAELDKLLLYAKGRKEIGREDALACLGYRRTSNPFDLPRVLQSRRLAQALDLLRRLFAEGTSEFRLLSQITAALNKQLKAKRMLAAGAPEVRVFRELRLQEYYDRDFLRHAGAVTEARLIRDLKACLRTEIELKSKTWLDPQVELERLVAGLCAPGKSL